MFTINYPTPAERRAYVERAHRLRAAVVASLLRDVARWVSAAAR